MIPDGPGDSEDGGRPADCDRSLSPGLELRPTDVEMMLRLAMAYDATGRPQEALPFLEEALRLKPDLHPVRNYLRALKFKRNAELCELSAARRSGMGRAAVSSCRSVVAHDARLAKVRSARRSAISRRGRIAAGQSAPWLRDGHESRCFSSVTDLLQLVDRFGDTLDGRLFDALIIARVTEQLHDNKQVIQVARRCSIVS